MAFIDNYAVALDPAFRKVAVVALTRAATAVVGEAQGGMSVTKLGKRHDYAGRVLARPLDFIDTIAFLLASNGVTAATADATVQSTIATNWDKLSGVKVTD